MKDMRTDKVRTDKVWMAAAGAATLLSACNVKDDIHETEHPEQGKITVTTDWTNRGEGIAVPGSYTVRVGDFSATMSGETATPDRLFDPGDYTVHAFNSVEGITVSGTTATVAASGGNIDPFPGWFFTGRQEIAIEKDKDHAFTVAMRQQVRQLTLVVEPTGGTADRIEVIGGTLSGVASTLDFDSDTHGTASTVALAFTKITEGVDAGKWTATVRLLGITGGEQKLTGTITFTDGSPADAPLESDLSASLASFNADKKTPLTLGGSVAETPTGTGFTAAITGWKVVVGGSGTAN